MGRIPKPLKISSLGNFIAMLYDKLSEASGLVEAADHDEECFGAL